MHRTRVRLIPGLALGHYTDERAKTGCTVLVCERGAAVGVDIRGSASGTREIDACRPDHLVEKVHAIVIAGGSAFGLASADGVMEYLEQRHVGFDVGVTHVPIVASAILYDLGVGSPWVRPDRQAGYTACASARGDRVEQGAVGAGTGATVGKLFGMECASPGGFGFACLTVPTSQALQHPPKKRRREGMNSSKIVIQAFVAVNAFGDVINPRSGRIIAGARVSPKSSLFVDTYRQMKRGVLRTGFTPDPVRDEAKGRGQSRPKSRMTGSARASQKMLGEQMPPSLRRMFEREGADTGSRFNLQNTTIAVVATDAAFNKLQMQKIAQMAQNGVARVLCPAHTLFDGDTVFALSIPPTHRPKSADLNLVGEAAAEVVAEAIVQAVLSSTRRQEGMSKKPGRDAPVKRLP